MYASVACYPSIPNDIAAAADANACPQDARVLQMLALPKKHDVRRNNRHVARTQ
jgi:hypothetical protein